MSWGETIGESQTISDADLYIDRLVGWKLCLNRLFPRLVVAHFAIIVDFGRCVSAMVTPMIGVSRVGTAAFHGRSIYDENRQANSDRSVAGRLYDGPTWDEYPDSQN